MLSRRLVGVLTLVDIDKSDGSSVDATSTVANQKAEVNKNNE